MGRQFKFRIWDRQFKHFVENDAGTHCASRWLIDAFTGRPVDFVVGFEDPEFGSLSELHDYYIEGTKVVKEPQYVVQEFTGVLDVYSNEIYEGDIIEYRQHLFNTSPHNFPINTKEVKWDETLAKWNIYSTNAGESEIRIIGNIWRNPKLDSMLDSSIASLKEGKASVPVNLTKLADE